VERARIEKRLRTPELALSLAREATDVFGIETWDRASTSPTEVTSWAICALPQIELARAAVR
jgi:hypothetical protein